MYQEFYEGVHYVVEEREYVEPEIPELRDRLPDKNLWGGCDWHFYYCGEEHGKIGLSPQCENPFYILGHEAGFGAIQKPLRSS